MSEDRPRLTPKYDPRSRRRFRGARWLDWPVVVVCGRHRVLEAQLSDDGELLVRGLGLGAGPKRRGVDGPPLMVGCPTHREHAIDRRRLAVELSSRRFGRRRVPVTAVVVV